MNGTVKNILIFLSGCFLTLFFVRVFSVNSYYESPYNSNITYIESALTNELEKLLKETRKEVLERLKKELCQKDFSEKFEI